MNNNNNKLKKGMALTDIHFGKKNNSEMHNLDCLNYLDWFCQQVRSDPEIEYIAFLGDWHENRSALNLETLNFSQLGAKKLNQLGLPVYFCVGNHDLYRRHTREIHSLPHFEEFGNFILINEPTIVDEIEGGVVFSPFLFPDEYPDLDIYKEIPIWMGHFEFKGFVITGHNVIMPVGPDIEDFNDQALILSGHFHKRQRQKNTQYIGNTFPMDFGDAGDVNRGLAIVDHVKRDVSFIDWEECPKYTKTTISDLIEENVTIHKHSRVSCVQDVVMTFEELVKIKQKYIEEYDLREFTVDEISTISEAVSDTETEVELTDITLESVDELVIQMLNDINNDQIDNELLIQIYKNLNKYEK